MNNFLSQTAKTTRDLAKNAAKKTVLEPFEILKQGSEQIIPEPKIKKPNPENRSFAKEHESVDEQKIKQQEREALDRLEEELKKISHQKSYEQAVEKVNRGEAVYLADYPELSWEEKQVLSAQIKVVKQRQNRVPEEVPTIASKPSRRFLGIGGKASAQKQATRIEKPLPPSG